MNTVLKDFLLGLYKIGLDLKFEKKPPDTPKTKSEADTARKDR